MNIHSNIWKLYFIKSLRSFLVMMPIVTIFFNSIWMRQYEIMLAQVVFSLSLILFEIPSWYFSDRVSRKVTLIIASFFACIGMFFYAIASDFTMILIAEIILGISASFMSGTDSAMIYDSLLEIWEKDRYKKIKWKIISFQSTSEAIAWIIGGFLAVLSIHYPLWLQFFCMLPIIPLAFSLVEPTRHSTIDTTAWISNIGYIFNFALHKNKNILWLMIYSWLLGASTLSLVWLIQPYLKSINMPIEWYGILWAIFNFSIGIFALKISQYENLFWRKYALVGLLLMIFVGYISVGLLNSYWGISFIFIFYCVRAWQDPIIEEYIHELVPSHLRATILSIKGMFGRFVFMIVWPLIGWLHDVYSLSFALIFSAFLFLIFGILCLFMLSRHKAL